VKSWLCELHHNPVAADVRRLNSPFESSQMQRVRPREQVPEQFPPPPLVRSQRERLPPGPVGALAMGRRSLRFWECIWANLVISMPKTRTRTDLQAENH
jgi:hypothetical protein